MRATKGACVTRQYIGIQGNNMAKLAANLCDVFTSQQQLVCNQVSLHAHLPGGQKL